MKIDALQPCPRQSPRLSAVSLAGFIGGELLFLGLTQAYGGQAWAILCLLAILPLFLTDFRIASLSSVAPSLSWLALFYATGNRELFFPYCMYLATAIALLLSRRTLWLGGVGGGTLIVAFMTVRILQQATLRVLAVELAAAVVILAAAITTDAYSRKTAVSRAAIAALASVLAYAALAL